MDHVPRIEVHSWNTQHSLNSPFEGTVSVPPLEYLPIQSTLLDQPGDNHNPPLLTAPTTPTDPVRPRAGAKPRHFWSPIRRSKSDDGFYGDDSLNCKPQPAMPGGQLIWSAERHIWLFERRKKRRGASSNASTASTATDDARWHHFAFGHYSHSSHPRPRPQPQDSVNSGVPAKLRKQNNTESTHQRRLEPGLRPRAISAIMPSRQHDDNGAHDENNDVELLSAQLLPGHYSLSVYDYVGNGSLQQQQSSESLNTLAAGYSERAVVSPNTPAVDHVSNAAETNRSSGPYADEDEEEEEPSGPWMSIASKFARRRRLAGEE